MCACVIRIKTYQLYALHTRTHALCRSHVWKLFMHLSSIRISLSCTYQNENENLMLTKFPGAIVIVIHNFSIFYSVFRINNNNLDLHSLVWPCHVPILCSNVFSFFSFIYDSITTYTTLDAHTHTHIGDIVGQMEMQHTFVRIFSRTRTFLSFFRGFCQ